MRDSLLVVLIALVTKLLHKVLDARLKLTSTVFSDGQLIKQSINSSEGFEKSLYVVREGMGMNVPAKPPIERSEVTVKGEIMVVISGACVSSAVSYYVCVSQRTRIQSLIITYHYKAGEVFSVGDHHLLSSEGDIRKQLAASTP